MSIATLSRYSLKKKTSGCFVSPPLLPYVHGDVCAIRGANELVQISERHELHDERKVRRQSDTEEFHQIGMMQLPATEVRKTERESI
jgi:hypothetical protein